MHDEEGYGDGSWLVLLLQAHAVHRSRDSNGCLESRVGVRIGCAQTTGSELLKPDELLKPVLKPHELLKLDELLERL